MCSGVRALEIYPLYLDTWFSVPCGPWLPDVASAHTFTSVVSECCLNISRWPPLKPQRSRKCPQCLANASSVWQIGFQCLTNALSVSQMLPVSCRSLPVSRQQASTLPRAILAGLQEASWLDYGLVMRTLSVLYCTRALLLASGLFGFMLVLLALATTHAKGRLRRILHKYSSAP